MYLHFKEEFDLPIHEIFPYFESPSEWARLYGVVKPTRVLKDDWHAIPLKKVPFPLLAKNVDFHHEKSVRWIFGGFWRGVGEVNFSSQNNKTIVEGFEYITPHGAWFLSSLVERHLMEEEFTRIWNLGWKRIRKNRKGEGHG